MWFKWFLVAYLVLSILTTVIMVDERREPITKGAATFNVLCYGLAIAGLLYYWK